MYFQMIVLSQVIQRGRRSQDILTFQIGGLILPSDSITLREGSQLVDECVGSRKDFLLRIQILSVKSSLRSLHEFLYYESFLKLDQSSQIEVLGGHTVRRVRIVIISL